MTWDATNSRLGIGTNAPTKYLELKLPTGVNTLNNGITITRGSGTGVFLLGNGTTNTSDFIPSIYSKSSVNNAGFYFAASVFSSSSTFPAMEFQAANSTNTDAIENSQTVARWANWTTQLMQIRGNGNLLLQNGGTFTDSGDRLQVTGTAYISGSVTFTSSTGMFWNAANSRLGIGTSSPAQKLHVVGNATYRGIYPYFELVPSAWSGGYFYLQCGTDVTGSVEGSYTVCINTQTTRGFSWNQGIGAGSPKMVLTPNTYNLLIGTTTDVASSKLTINSTTQGFLPPRMTTTEKNAISSPAAGLVVYDTTLNKLCVYTTAWETITSI
jgi:hypothetical protein